MAPPFKCGQMHGMHIRQQFPAHCTINRPILIRPQHIIHLVHAIAI